MDGGFLALVLMWIMVWIARILTASIRLTSKIFQCLQGTGGLIGPGLTGDLNLDEVVDEKDLEIFAYYWLSDCY